MDLEFGGKILFRADAMRCKCGCGLLRLAPNFGRHLIVLRVALDEPMHELSVCRCKKHNAKVGGHPRSLHVGDFPAHPTAGCAAIDVRSQDVAYNARLIDCALGLGWSVGVARWGLHLDRRTDIGLPQGVFAY